MHRNTLSAPGTTRSRTFGSVERKSFHMGNTRRIMQLPYRNILSNRDNTKFIEPPTMGKTQFKSHNESFEIAFHLKTLRKNHDRQVWESQKLEQTIRTLGVELHSVKNQQMYDTSNYQRLLEKQQELKDNIERTKNEQQAARQTTKIYDHVLHRMKQTIIHLDMKQNELLSDVRNKSLLENDLRQKNFRGREKSKRTHNAVRDLETTIKETQLEQSVVMSHFNQNIAQRQATALQRDERARRQIEISETAANEDRDKRAQKMREGLMVHRLWLNYLNWKLQDEKIKSHSIETAFQQIRSATGLNDIGEVVERFLTREQSYSSVLENLSRLQEQINSIKDENDKIENDIKLINLIENVEDPLLQKYHSQMSEQYREIEEAKTKHNKLLIVYKKVTNWIRRLIRLLKVQQNEPIDDLPDNLQELVNILKESLQKLLDQVDEEEIQQFIVKESQRKIDDIMQNIPKELMKTSIRATSPEAL